MLAKPAVETAAATDRLFTIEDAFDYTEENDRLFVDAMKEMIAWHRERSPVYDGICRQHGFEAEQVRGIDDVYAIPHVIVSAFKERKILSVPESEIVRTFTSSGTGGTVSQINWDAVSQERQEYTRRRIVASYGLASAGPPVNYVVFNYDPGSAGTRGAAHTHLGYTEFAPSKETFWAISAADGGEARFRLEPVIEKLRAFERDGAPLRLVGFPAFSWATMKALEERGLALRFPPESAVFLGGGWKLHTGMAVSFDEYADLAGRVLGIARERIRDVYGMVEHGIPYVTCEAGRFHVPIWSRVCAIHPGTLAILPEGETGLLELVTPYIRSVPAISVLSTDLGAVASGCACGRGGRTLALHGRGGVQKYAGCAISAAQLLGQ